MLPGLLKTGSENLKCKLKRSEFQQEVNKLPVLIECIKDAALTLIPHHHFNC
jgi:hypothetical protein